MILTEVFVMMCALTGADCISYATVAPGYLTATACEHAIQQIADTQPSAGRVLRRERSSCTLMPVSTQNDLSS